MHTIPEGTDGNGYTVVREPQVEGTEHAAAEQKQRLCRGANPTFQISNLDDALCFVYVYLVSVLSGVPVLVLKIGQPRAPGRCHMARQESEDAEEPAVTGQRECTHTK